MSTTVFVAGATGVIGIRLVRLLRDAGYHVFGTTRYAAKSEALEAAGATPVIVDVYDADALLAQTMSIRPVIVVHQLTDLPRALDPSRMAGAIVANAHLRRVGTRNLVAAACAAGAQRVIAQSIAWMYTPGTLPHAESDPLDAQADGARGVSVGGVIALEQLVMGSPPLQGTVLRYGRLYGGDTGADRADAPAVHVDAAAHAALLAVARPLAGVFNIADDNDIVATDKARRELGWRPDFRLPD